jgi:hypothetical protein
MTLASTKLRVCAKVCKDQTWSSMYKDFQHLVNKHCSFVVLPLVYMCPAFYHIFFPPLHDSYLSFKTILAYIVAGEHIMSMPFISLDTCHRMLHADQ